MTFGRHERRMSRTFVAWYPCEVVWAGSLVHARSNQLQLTATLTRDHNNLPCPRSPVAS